MMQTPAMRGRRESDEEMLRRHIAAAGKNYSTEELVEHLRSRHPCYARHKLRPFTKRVESTIRASRSRRRRAAAADGDSPTAKRRKFVVSSSSSSASPSGNSPYYDDSSDEETAASEEKSEPAFDLLKSTMREELSLKSKRIVVHEELELETADGKAANLRREKDTIEREARVCSKEPMLEDFGGINELMKELKKKVLWPFYHPELPRVDGAEPITGILLKGPPGCGKSTLARAMANEKGVPLFEVSAAELVSGVSGESEQNIRELFSKAQRSAPSIVFIDEIDSIASKRENLNRGMEQRIVTQLMASMDESHKLVFDKKGYVLVIGATNNPDSIDSALRRPGRFDLEFFLGVPDEKARAQILSRLLCNAGVDGAAFDVGKIARSTPGFVGADLKAVIRAASNLATSRPLEKRVAECSKTEEYCGCCRNCLISPLLDEEKENMNITMADIEEAVKIVQPSSKREGFSAIPDVTWDDVGGLRFLREEFYYDMVARIKSPQYYEELGMDLATGFLLYGPPGCGKTLVAQAVANEAGANFIYIKGPELLNKYVGESELAVRTLFSRARTCSPCILFIDEVDALTRERGKEGSSVIQQVVNQLLIEMDGSEKRKGVYVIGTTNRPDVMDPALLRPGRFGNLVYVPLPSPEERGMILKALARKKAVDPNMDLMALGMDSRCHNFSGADLSKLMHRAARAALKDKLSSKKASATRLTIKDEHFIRALDEMSPSVSDKQIQEYKLLSQSFKS